MNLSQNLDYLKGLNLSSLPENIAASVKDYTEIAESLDNDTELLAQLDGYDTDINQLVTKIQSLTSTPKAKGSANGKATKARTVKAKAAKAARTANTKKKVAKRTENKLKIILTETVKVKEFLLKKDGKFLTNHGMEKFWFVDSEEVAYRFKDEATIKKLKKEYGGTIIDLSKPANVAVKQKVASTEAVKKKAIKRTEIKPKIVAKPVKTKAPTKSTEKFEAKLREVKVEFNHWITKVEKEEVNLKKLIEMVSPTIKAEGLGLSKVQLEIKQYEAYISILKRIFMRDVKIQKSIMDKAKKALRPQDVESLSKAILKAQNIMSPIVGLSGIRQVIKDKPKAKKRAKVKKVQVPVKKGLLAKISEFFS